MSATCPPYASEIRQQMVELVRAGRSPKELAREFEPPAQSIRNRVGQAERDEGRSHNRLTSVKPPPGGRPGSVARVTGACVCDGSGVNWPWVG